MLLQINMIGVKNEKIIISGIALILLVFMIAIVLAEDIEDAESKINYLKDKLAETPPDIAYVDTRLAEGNNIGLLNQDVDLKRSWLKAHNYIMDTKVKINSFDGKTLKISDPKRSVEFDINLAKQALDKYGVDTKVTEEGDLIFRKDDIDFARISTRTEEDETFNPKVSMTNDGQIFIEGGSISLINQEVVGDKPIVFSTKGEVTTYYQDRDFSSAISSTVTLSKDNIAIKSDQYVTELSSDEEDVFAVFRGEVVMDKGGSKILKDGTEYTATYYFQDFLSDYVLSDQVRFDVKGDVLYVDDINIVIPKGSPESYIRAYGGNVEIHTKTGAEITYDDFEAKLLFSDKLVQQIGGDMSGLQRRIDYSFEKNGKVLGQRIEKGVSIHQAPITEFTKRQIGSNYKQHTAVPVLPKGLSTGYLSAEYLESITKLEGVSTRIYKTFGIEEYKENQNIFTLTRQGESILGPDLLVTAIYDNDGYLRGSVNNMGGVDEKTIRAVFPNYIGSSTGVRTDVIENPESGFSVTIRDGIGGETIASADYDKQGNRISGPSILSSELTQIPSFRLDYSYIDRNPNTQRPGIETRVMIGNQQIGTAYYDINTEIMTSGPEFMDREIPFYTREVIARGQRSR